MRNFPIILSALLLGTIVLAGCNSAPKVATTQTTPTKTTEPPTTISDGARRITVAEAQELIKKGQAFVVDVRNQPSYDVGHIPGATLIPAQDILKHVNELPRDKTIITYCS